MARQIDVVVVAAVFLHARAADLVFTLKHSVNINSWSESVKPFHKSMPPRYDFLILVDVCVRFWQTVY